MAISPLCPETGLPCAGREWLIEIQQSQDLEQLDADLQIYSDKPSVNMLMRTWDKLAGHVADRRLIHRSVIQAIDEAAEHHETAAEAADQPNCGDRFCGTMAQLICDQVIKRP